MEEAFRIVERDNTIYPMGLTISDGILNFTVAAEGERLSLNLYRKGEEVPVQILYFPADRRMGDVWSMAIRGSDLMNLEYCYQIDGKLMPDPCGRLFTGRDSWGNLEVDHTPMRTPVWIEEFNWENDYSPSIPYENSVIYRAHIRGLTKHSSSNVKAEGTFQAVEEKIPYLQDLGITALELMPINEFDEVIVPEYVKGNPYGIDKPTGKLNYWGYTKGYYFAPKASYSSGQIKDPVSELKHLVKELHQAGIEIIVELFFYGDENPSFVLDAVRYWVREYHLDGIHLVGSAPMKLIGNDPYLKHVKLFATDWDGARGGKARNLAEYHDGFLVDMRRVLKGDEDQMNRLVYRSRHNPKEYGIVNYIANTNGFTMMDLVSYDRKHNEANGENNQDGNAYNYSWNCGVEGPTRKKKTVNLRKKQIRNALLLLFLSQGTPLILAGDEFGNSKSGNNNSYCQDNEISYLNWNQLKTNRDIYAFVRHIIAFRKAHPVFHMTTEPQVMDYLACGHPDISYHGVKTWCPEFENFRRQLGILYCGEYAKKADGSQDDYFYVAYNMHWESHEFALPKLPKKRKWYLALDTDCEERNGIFPEGKEPVLEDQKRFLVPPRTIAVFIGI